VHILREGKGSVTAYFELTVFSKADIFIICLLRKWLLALN